MKRGVEAMIGMQEGKASGPGQDRPPRQCFCGGGLVLNSYERGRNRSARAAPLVVSAFVDVKISSEMLIGQEIRTRKNLVGFTARQSLDLVYRAFFRDGLDRGNG